MKKRKEKIARWHWWQKRTNERKWLNKEKKKQMCDNLDNNKIGELKNVDNKIKKEKCDNLDTNETELL